jgi:hypothetical protein
MGTAADAYWARMETCARAVGRELGPLKPHHVDRLVEGDAALVEQGFNSGLLAITKGRNVVTGDPLQATAWLVEGNPAWPCWEYLPHLAGYVHLIDELAYPRQAVRFETPDRELRLDLAVLDESGFVLVLGEVKVMRGQLDGLESGVATFQGDPGEPLSVKGGGPQGMRREAWKLAHQLWVTRAPYLWLVAAGTRRAFDVTYAGRISLQPRVALPAAEDLWPAGFSRATTPTIALANES